MFSFFYQHPPPAHAPTVPISFFICTAEVPPTHNVCIDGQSLLIDAKISGVVEATCGRSPHAIRCPPGYICNIAINDAYAVCCPGKCT